VRVLADLRDHTVHGHRLAHIVRGGKVMCRCWRFAAERNKPRIRRELFASYLTSSARQTVSEYASKAVVSPVPTRVILLNSREPEQLSALSFRQ
jgi:hypothetical protein